MKKIFKLIMSLLLICLVSVNYINAECKDEELNEWATKVEPIFRENTYSGSNISRYAYFLSINPYREDVRIIVSDESGNKANGEKFEEIDLYGVGAYTNLEEETYTIKVYGGKDSKCKNELLKTLTYTVPRFNRRVKDQRCEDNSELEICKTFTNSTKDMTDEEFNKQINQYIEENNPTTLSDIIKAIISYAIFIFVPAMIVGIFYSGKIRKVKKEERDK